MTTHLNTYLGKFFNNKNKLIQEEIIMCLSFEEAKDIVEDFMKKIDNADSYQIFQLY